VFAEKPLPNLRSYKKEGDGRPIKCQFFQMDSDESNNISLLKIDNDQYEMDV